MKFKENFKRFMTLNRHSDAGFTLVELIVVIAILAILAGVAVPVYSGYIAKAEKAGDQQLMSVVNRAYAAAVLENGKTMAELANVAVLHIDGEGAVSDLTFNTRAAIDDIKTSFFLYFDGNGTFKTIKSTTLKAGAEGFSLPGEGGKFDNVANTLKDKFSEAIANKIHGTTLGGYGTDALFGQMNNAMDLAGELNLYTLAGDPFAAAFLGYMGINPEDYDSDEAAQEALNAKLDSLNIEDVATAYTHAIALYAAQNSTNLTTSDLTNLLSNNSSIEDLQSTPNANVLAQSAAIYAMYLSYYKETNNGAAPTDQTLDIMVDALSDANFANWVSSDKAKTELDAYKTYMDIVNEAAQDDNTRNEILANGFKNDELSQLMKDLMGN